MQRGLLFSSLIPYNYRLAFYEPKIKAVKDIDCNPLVYAPFEFFFAILYLFGFQVKDLSRVGKSLFFISRYLDILFFSFI